MSSLEQMEKVFRELGLLIENGEFTKQEIGFMETFLEAALGSVQRLKSAMESKDDS